MGKFRRDRRDDRRDRGDSRSNMHHAICDDCGKSCQVPFRPTGNKPIYCDNCFHHHKDERGTSGKRNFQRRDRDFKRQSMYSAVCDECGKSCEVPFKPTEGKPVYCDECFGSKDKGAGKNTNNKVLEEKIDALMNKVDKIIADMANLNGKNAKEEKEEIEKPKGKAKPKQKSTKAKDVKKTSKSTKKKTKAKSKK